MKRLLILPMILMAALVTSTVTAISNDLSFGSARLREIDESGVKARVIFLDTGSQLIVIGKASGLDPFDDYISLVYNIGSVSTGPTACTPTSNLLTAEQMNVGMWNVADNGTGTLFAVKTDESYAALSDIGTMSVRRILGPPPDVDSPPPTDLEACGTVRSND